LLAGNVLQIPQRTVSAFFKKPVRRTLRAGSSFVRFCGYIAIVELAAPGGLNLLDALALGQLLVKEPELINPDRYWQIDQEQERDILAFRNERNRKN
jgi:hypothetical protein